jgi:pimeloyl-ACP methyl ester carboxylesterase
VTGPNLRGLPPRLVGIVVGGRAPPYSIGDMAADVTGLIDGLGLGEVHLVGVSMGGFIAQAVPLERPGRVRTLTTIMTSRTDESALVHSRFPQAEPRTCEEGCGHRRPPAGSP